MDTILKRAAAGIGAAGLAIGLTAAGATTASASPTPFAAPLIGVTGTPPLGYVELTGDTGAESGEAVVSVARVCNAFLAISSMDGCAAPVPVLATFNVQWFNITTGKSGVAQIAPGDGPAPMTTSTTFDSGPGNVIAIVTSPQIPASTPGFGSFNVG